MTLSDHQTILAVRSLFIKELLKNKVKRLRLPSEIREIHGPMTILIVMIINNDNNVFLKFK